MITEVKRLKDITCPCCKSADIEKHHGTSFGLTVFKCQKCNLYIHTSKECCYYSLYNMPRHTNYQTADSGWAGENCIVCGKYATEGRSGSADNSEEWANPCQICGALMHGASCGGHSERYCPECRKYQDEHLRQY